MLLSSQMMLHSNRWCYTVIEHATLFTEDATQVCPLCNVLLVIEHASTDSRGVLKHQVLSYTWCAQAPGACVDSSTNTMLASNRTCEHRLAWYAQAPGAFLTGKRLTISYWVGTHTRKHQVRSLQASVLSSAQDSTWKGTHTHNVEQHICIYQQAHTRL